MHRLLACILATLCISGARAANTQPSDPKLFSGFSFSFCKGTSATASEEEPPRVTAYGMGLTLGYKIAGPFFVGAHLAYTLVDQISEPNDISGNRRGKRWALYSPSVGIHYRAFQLRTNVEFGGAYRLSLPDAAGNAISYGGALGFGAEALLRVTPRQGLGFRFTTVSFSKQQVGADLPSKLVEKLVLWGAGLVLDVHF